MAALFSKPKIPPPQEPVKLPDQQTNELREARRLRLATESGRSGRASTVLASASPTSSPATGSAGKIGA